MADPDNEGNDPGFDPRPDPAPLPPELALLQQKIGAAIDAVTDIGGYVASQIVAKQAAEARAKEWADIAYEMWALLVNSVHNGHGAPGTACTVWETQKKALRERLHAALKAMPEDV